MDSLDYILFSAVLQIWRTLDFYRALAGPVSIRFPEAFHRILRSLTGFSILARDDLRPIRLHSMDGSDAVPVDATTL